jgi:Fungal Zn(2)-Cys(6) binuclear cluster domain
MDPQSRFESASPGAGGRDDRAPKKRTKTGCQTCRSRRIKCDEAKPVCNNCTKGKRICEGKLPPPPENDSRDG